MERYARRCDATNKGMNEGFCFGDGDMYFANEDDAFDYAIKIGYKGLQDAFDDEAYYWTEWYDQDDIEYQGYYYTEEGEEIEL